MEKSASGKLSSRRYDEWKANKGESGIDGMTVEPLSGHLKEHLASIENNSSAEPMTPTGERWRSRKPAAEVRKLASNVLDRFIQQTVRQALQRSWDGTFSEQAMGSAKRSAHQEVEAGAAVSSRRLPLW